MGGFEDREAGLEAEYFYRKAQNIKNILKRNHKFGESVADMMGLDGWQAAAYASKLSDIHLEEHTDSSIVNQAFQDLYKFGCEVSRDDVLHLLNEVTEVIEGQIEQINQDEKVHSDALYSFARQKPF